MRTLSAVATVLALLLCRPLYAASNCRQPAAVCTHAVPGALALIDHGRAAGIVADAGDFPGVLIAARSLQSDLSSVSGTRVTFSTAARPAQHVAIIVGTLGRSARVDRIVHAKGIDTRGVAGHWEGYLLQVVDHPEPGIDRALLIAGADQRGTIYGIYELSRRIGVSPWVWWADVPVRKHAELNVAPGRFIDAPKVRYRGIFINDEDPALGGWMKAKFGGDNHRFYQHVFELLLRLKANTLWPAMWGNRSFFSDDPLNPALASKYGVIIGTSHVEPMLRAHAEWKRYGKGPWNYRHNKKELDQYWRHGIERMKGRDALVTIGMRGDGDKPLTQGTHIHLLEHIIADQRRIIAGVTGKPARRTPQVLTLYKEVQDYMDAGMQVPDDVTLVYCDDNWGNIRRLPKPGKKRSGGYGIYYHFDYVGGPRSYKWIDTVQIERIWEQMHLAYAYGARRLWIVNVGDIKPLEFPISFFLDYAWDPDAFSLQQLRDYPAKWAAQQFGPRYAHQIGKLLTRYTQYNARRKPSLLSPDTYSLVNYHEAERVLAEWESLARQAKHVGGKLPAVYRDAYYELVEYPVLASANLNELYVAVARNHLYAAQGRAATNAQAAKARSLFKRAANLAHVYQHDIAGGKWAHMMSQPYIGYTGWHDPASNVMPAVRTLDVPAKASMGLAIEGDTRAWPGAASRPKLPPLDPFGARTRELTIFNRGSTPFHYTADTSQPWLQVLPASGEVGSGRTLQVRVDWSKAPHGLHTAELTLRGSDGTRLQIEVPVDNPPHRAAMTGFIETDGHVVIDAAHYARAVTAPGLSWKTIPNLGRSLSGVTSWPATTPARLPGNGDALLEYPVYLQQPGRFEVRVIVSPSLDFLHRGGLRFAVSIDDDAPRIVTIKADPRPGSAGFQAWERAVSDSVYVATTHLYVNHAGAKTLKLWRVDPGVVFQRVELIHGPLRTSYLGPPESTRLPERR
ncbi:MAG: glycosyl hydrolase 115 family protein [Rhodanobacteraceae bacterium]